MSPIQKSFLFKFSIFCLLTASVCGAAKILVFSPTISRSHMISNARIADSLAKDGHRVTLLELEYNVPVNAFNASKFARTIKVKGPFIKEAEKMAESLSKFSFMPSSLPASFFMLSNWQSALNEACEKFVLEQPELMERLRAERFNMIFTEQLNLCGTGVAHLLQIKTHILISSCPLQEHISSILGLSNPSSYVPSLFDSNLPDRMTLWERAENLLRHFAGQSYSLYGVDPLTRIFRKHFGDKFPDLRSIVANSPFVFVNVDELVDFPRPIFSNVVYIGGLGMNEQNVVENNLQEPFKSEMEKGEKGVVFFSTGSIIRTTHVDEQFRRNIFEAFSQFPDYQFIMKIDKDDNFSMNLTKNLKNVFITSWVPQTQILSHRRLKLFVTHGGYNSLMESARAGIPLISMGFFADQFRNARVAERNGWALPFDKQLLLHGAEEFRAALSKVLLDSNYKLAAKRIQKLVLNKPFSAEERLQKSVRFLELSGGQLPELLSESRNMSTIAFYNLDLALLALLFSILMLTVSAIFVRTFWRYFGQKGFGQFGAAASSFFFKSAKAEGNKKEE